jgi:tRNA (cmo5U34)-methyltransferase
MHEMHTTGSAPRLEEDWFDEAFVAHWIDRERGRAALRARHFGMLRALLPFKTDASFRYLNVGAGPGALDELILARYPKANAVLLDSSPVMLRHATQRLAPFGERASCAQADLSSPEWVTAVRGPFDAVVSCIAIHNLRDPRLVRRLYADIQNLLGEGRGFFNLDYVRSANEHLRPVARWAAADEDGGFIGGGGRGGSDHFPGTVEEQVQWLREADFAFADCFFKDFGTALIGAFRGIPTVPEPPRAG